MKLNSVTSKCVTHSILENYYIKIDIYIFSDKNILASLLNCKILY